MEIYVKEEEVWEVDLDPDAEPTIDLSAPRLSFECGFCNATLPNGDMLLTHATEEHDISLEFFEGVSLEDTAAVKEAFFKAANQRREFVSLGDVERCPKCNSMFASAALLAKHDCTKEEHADPLKLKPRDPLQVARVDAEIAKAKWKVERNSKVGAVLNSMAKSVLVNRIVKPLAKPLVKLTVGNVIEMALVEIITQAGLKISPAEDFNEECAVDAIYQLCLLNQKDMSKRLREIPAFICNQLLHLLRSRRVRVVSKELPGNSQSSTIVGCTVVEDQVRTSIGRTGRTICYGNGKNMSLARPRTILPAPTANGSHLTLMEELLNQPEASKKIIFPERVRAVPSLFPKSQGSRIEIFLEPPTPNYQKDIKYICNSCDRKFESEYQLIKHMHWQSFEQKKPVPIFCRFCPKRNRYFAFCEKGFRQHVMTQHQIQDTYAGTLSVYGHILTHYKCAHCSKNSRAKTFIYQALFRRHLTTCCRQISCKKCPAYFKNVPARKSKKRKAPSPLTVEKPAEKKKKSSKLAPVECIVIKQEAEDDDLDQPSSPQSSNLEIDEFREEPEEQTEEIYDCIKFIDKSKGSAKGPLLQEVVIKEEEVDADSGGPYRCVVCDKEEITAERLRLHFTSKHSDLIDEFQVSVSHCGSVSVRWVCPFCGQIFHKEADFLGHMDHHGLTAEAVLARASDLRHLPSLRAVLLALKSKK